MGYNIVKHVIQVFFLTSVTKGPTIPLKRYPTPPTGECSLCVSRLGRLNPGLRDARMRVLSFRGKTRYVVRDFHLSN